jgi:peptide/nickel transport system ATP-binding protein
VSVQAQVLRLLKSIQDETGITYVFISHNLGVVQEISDSVMVMQKGKLVEHGTTASVLTAPKEDYTRKLRRAALDPSTMVGVKPRHLVRSLALANQSS